MGIVYFYLTGFEIGKALARIIRAGERVPRKLAKATTTLLTRPDHRDATCCSAQSSTYTAWGLLVRVIRTIQGAPSLPELRADTSRFAADALPDIIDGASWRLRPTDPPDMVGAAHLRLWFSIFRVWRARRHVEVREHAHFHFFPALLADQNHTPIGGQACWGMGACTTCAARGGTSVT